MNSQDLRQRLEQLDDTVWQQLLDGMALRLQNDEELQVAEMTDKNLIVPSQSDSGLGVPELRKQIVEQAKELLEEYYRVNPLSQHGFNKQVMALIERHGATAFAAEYGEVPERTLFVEVGDVVAETAESPRHRYGAFCELDAPLSASALMDVVLEWVTSGAAYEKYVSMNVCRYSC